MKHKKLKTISLDEIPEIKHDKTRADKIIVLNDRAVIIEEKEKADMHCINQLEATINMIKEGKLSKYINNPKKLYCIIHYTKKIDQALTKALPLKQREFHKKHKAPLAKASCNHAVNEYIEKTINKT